MEIAAGRAGRSRIDPRGVRGWSAGARWVCTGTPSTTLADALSQLGLQPLQTGADWPVAELSALAAAAARPSGHPLVLCAADLELSLPALLDLLDRPGVPTAALVAPPPDAGTSTCAPARVGRDRALLESVGTPDHPVSRPTDRLAGVLRVDPADLPSAARVWAEAAGSGTPSGGGGADVFDLAVLALVRAGVAVRAVPLGPYDWTRGPDHQAGVHGDGWAQRLRAASRGDDGLYSTFAVRPLSRGLTAIVLARGWTPNAVTALSLTAGLAAAALVLTGWYPAWLLAAVLLQLALVVDCVDGETARYTRRFSPFGAWLDGVGDRVKEYAMFAALGVVAASSHGHGVRGWVLAGSALVVMSFRHLEDVEYTERMRPVRASQPDLLPFCRAGDSGQLRTDRAPTEFPPAPSRRSRTVFWAKKVVHLPIAERYLLLSLGLVSYRAELTLWVVTVAAALALAWTHVGRLLRALRGTDGLLTASLPPPGRWGMLDHELGLGPLARLTGRLVGAPFPLGLLALGILWTATFALPLTVRLPVAWRLLAILSVLVLLIVGVAARPTLRHRLAWQLPALLWLSEALAVLMLTALALPRSQAGVGYALLAVLAYHRYDTMYRLRETGLPPAPWVRLAGLGTDGRIVLVLAVAGWAPAALPAVLWVMIGVLAVVYLGESARSWVSRTGVPQPSGRPT